MLHLSLDRLQPLERHLSVGEEPHFPLCCIVLFGNSSRTAGTQFEGDDMLYDFEPEYKRFIHRSHYAETEMVSLSILDTGGPGAGRAGPDRIVVHMSSPGIAVEAESDCRSRI